MHRAELPRSSRYAEAWQLQHVTGPNPLWTAELLAAVCPLEPGMRVLELGSGPGTGAVFLAREHGVSVCAVDIEVDVVGVRQLARSAGVGHLVTSVRADARRLPFAAGCFDAVVSCNAYPLFGMDEGYLPYLLRLVVSGGRVGAVMPGRDHDPPGYRSYYRWRGVCLTWLASYELKECRVDGRLRFTVVWTTTGGGVAGGLRSPRCGPGRAGGGQRGREPQRRPPDPGHVAGGVGPQVPGERPGVGQGRAAGEPGERDVGGERLDPAPPLTGWARTRARYSRRPRRWTARPGLARTCWPARYRCRSRRCRPRWRGWFTLTELVGHGADLAVMTGGESRVEQAVCADLLAAMRGLDFTPFRCPGMFGLERPSSHLPGAQ
ncbi:class I SAM-dependent methyltransferase [Dactylosporangium fulvum]|uniref:Class I SAM-dependent methyltransferase n=1 Tax=Dactylosporangium fulvum TaxID=53359 RepID=A0ABY5VRW1_9ACTN|nr:class I SAM-dependent methyltransferase [Dactylosporangium fulvum]UWP80483.1 class I SAM-dependent methyltransferase [Dactylosporangium fulvum]